MTSIKAAIETIARHPDCPFIKQRSDSDEDQNGIIRKPGFEVAQIKICEVCGEAYSDGETPDCNLPSKKQSGD